MSAIGRIAHTVGPKLHAAAKDSIPPYISDPGLKAHADSVRPLMPLARAAARLLRAFPPFRISTERK